jgi:hypothetical protein
LPPAGLGDVPQIPQPNEAAPINFTQKISAELFASSHASFGLERITIWMLDSILAKVNVEVWPVEVTWRGFFDIQNFPYRNVFEPREVIV